MIKHDIHRYIAEPDWPGSRIYTRFVGAANFLALLDEYVPLMQDQALIRWKASLASRGAPENEAEVKEELDELNVRLNHDIAANFYGTFTLTVYSALESSLTDICIYVRLREKCELKLTDLREQNTVKRALLFLQVVLRDRFTGIELDNKLLRSLQNVRNAIAHANGCVVEQNPERRKELETFAATGEMIKIIDGHIVVQAKLLPTALDAAESLLNKLLTLVASKYPQPA
jgi:hypothetical protein